MEDTSGGSSGSDNDQPEDAVNEEKTRDSEETTIPRKEYHRAWRRFMRRQICGCPRHAFYGCGSQQPWLPPWVSPVLGGAISGRPMLPRPILLWNLRPVTRQIKQMKHMMMRITKHLIPLIDRLVFKLACVVWLTTMDSRVEMTFLLSSHIPGWCGRWEGQDVGRGSAIEGGCSGTCTIHKGHTGEVWMGMLLKRKNTDPEGFTEDKSDISMATTNPSPLDGWQAFL